MGSLIVSVWCLHCDSHSGSFASAEEWKVLLMNMCELCKQVAIRSYMISTLIKLSKNIWPLFGCCPTWRVLGIQFYFEMEGESWGLLAVAGRLNCLHSSSACPGSFLWDTWAASSRWLTSEAVVNTERRGTKVGCFLCRAESDLTGSCWSSCWKELG